MAAEEPPGDGSLTALQEQEDLPPATAVEQPEQENLQFEEEEPPIREPGEEEQPEAGALLPEEPKEPLDAGGPGAEEEEGAEEAEQKEEEAGVSEPGAEEPEQRVEEEEEEEQQEVPLVEGQRSPAGSEKEEKEEEEVEEEEQEEKPNRDEELRNELRLQYMALVTERDRLQQQSVLLQHKLCNHLRRQKSMDPRRSSAVRPPSTPTPTTVPAAELEQHYLHALESLKELRAQYAHDAALCQQQSDELRVHCKELLDQAGEEWQSYLERKKQVALAVLSRRGSRFAAAEEVEQLQAREQRKEDAVIQVRLENIKLKERVSALEMQLRASEELAGGLHLIDFEQLKIENQTYNEKIEERNEELLKLHRKITDTVHILAHLKEKLQCVQAENLGKKEQLAEVEAAVAHRRDILTKTKQARDSLRISNVKLRQKCGLLGNEALLRDFEEKTDASEELGRRLETLKRRHAELTLNCSGIKKKIKEAKEAKEAKAASQQ
ncbi:coiled-coil domain-containing protein 96 [Rhinatrema bivittatum]|uniref:coiled-coil domain-containing protein 96 n=1 Tax=Rhinatrema bivittatum TaxID=194408 RepID=UPI0011275BDC|nr:coiled-coil domain-containing protein 96 [Rhinatrema bivittatum]